MNSFVPVTGNKSSASLANVSMSPAKYTSLSFTPLFPVPAPLSLGLGSWQEQSPDFILNPSTSYSSPLLFAVSVIFLLALLSDLRENYLRWVI